jgi:hypothetical protein
MLAEDGIPEFLTPIKKGLPAKKQRVAELQRERRKRFRRVDFYAAPETVAVIEQLRTPRVDGTASAILNRIVADWAKASGIISP